MTFKLRRDSAARHITVKSILFLIALLGGHSLQHAEAAPWSLSVVDAKGQPVAAKVRLVRGYGLLPQFLETDAGGRLTGEAGPGIFATVFIFAPGHAPAGGTLHAGENRARLGVPRTLAGRVYDDDGKPLAGVEVELTNIMAERISGEKRTLENSVEFYLFERERSLFTVRTDATGRYELPNLPRSGTAIIAVRDPLWQNVSVRADLAAEAEAPELKTRPAARLSGRVMAEDGTPVKGLGITALVEKSHAATETDAEGRYLLGGLPAGEAKVHVGTNPQSDSGVAPPAEVVTVIGTETKIPDIHLTPGALVEIKTLPAVAGSFFALRREAATDSEGEYYLPADSGVLRARVLPGSYRLKLIDSPKGWIAPTEWPSEGLKLEAKDRQTTPIEVRLAPALTLAGVARDETGQPVSGVRFSSSGPYDYDEPSDETPGDPAAVSDAAGRFTLRNLKPGETILRAGAEWEIVQPKAITLPVQQPLVVTLKKITLAPLRGRVVDDKGRPVENAFVRVEWFVPLKEGVSTSRHRRVRTDAEGRYQVSGVRAESQVILKATKPGHRFMGGGELTIERTILAIDGGRIPNPNAEFLAADLVLQPLQREASGRVLDAEGKPVPNAFVAALGGGQDGGQSAPRNIAHTDALGHFKLRDLPEGELGFVAGTGDGFAQLRSEGTTLPDMVLQRQEPPVEDWALARQIVMELIANTDGSYYARQALPYTLAPYDYEAALEAANALEPTKRDNPRTRRSLMSQWMNSSPQSARLALPGMLPALENGGNAPWFASFVVDVAQLLETPEREVVPGEPEEAATVRTWVWRHYAQQHEKLLPLRLEQYSDMETAYEVMFFATLGAHLGREDAAQWARSAVQIATRFDATQANERSSGSVAAVVEGLAAGGTALVVSALEATPPQQRAYALGRAVPELARTDMAGARKLLELIPQQTKPEKSDVSNADPEWAFGLAAKAVLRRMTAADAADALALARRVTAEHHRAESLALAARLQPDGSALFHEAFDMAKSESADRGQMMVVAIALATDSGIGSELLAKMEERLFKPQRWDGDEGPVAAAFYLAQTQPGRARAWLEWKWAQAQNTIGGINGPSELKTIAMAMSAANTDRALEMADSIPPRTKPDSSEDQNQRWETKRKIAQYLLAPESVRRTLNFSRWGAGDTWTPGDDTGW